MLVFIGNSQQQSTQGFHLSLPPFSISIRSGRRSCTSFSHSFINTRSVFNNFPHPIVCEKHVLTDSDFPHVKLIGIRFEGSCEFRAFDIFAIQVRPIREKKKDFYFICATVFEDSFGYLDSPVETIAGVDVPTSYAANLERMTFPQDIVRALKRVGYMSAPMIATA
ncbi:hypothetical protein OSB04_007606 [Centaurea solstitialis]|uniref:Uncharacterized protein n=1 Tax=Centaurea solstitialis TaxID=347529 RepID=A0AA38WTD2_9ASTR|nr:hypothetical protein OSB04_007606 [Centaurea solstitialis]